MSSTATQQSDTITLDSLESHNTQESLWIAVHGHVYDLTRFSTDHPGGVDALLSSAGADGTEAYEYAGHSPENMDRMQQYRVGQLPGSSSSSSSFPVSGFPVAPSAEKMSAQSRRPTTTAAATTTKSSRRTTKLLTLSAVGLASLTIAAGMSSTLDARFPTTLLDHLSGLYQHFGISFWGNDGPANNSNVSRAFWAGMAMASSASLFGFRYLYLLFLSSLELQKDVFSFPPTIPRKMKR